MEPQTSAESAFREHVEPGFDQARKPRSTINNGGADRRAQADGDPPSSRERDTGTHVGSGSTAAGTTAPIPMQGKAGLPDIFVGEQQLRDMTDEVLASLAAQEKAAPRLFVRSAKMVRIVEDEEDHPMIVPVGEAELRGSLTRAANYYRLRNKGEEVYPVPIPPPKDVVHDILGLDPASWPCRP